jgi:hypothetical protein
MSNWRSDILQAAKWIKEEFILRGYEPKYILVANNYSIRIYGPCPDELPTARNDNDK